MPYRLCLLCHGKVILVIGAIVVGAMAVGIVSPGIQEEFCQFCVGGRFFGVLAANLLTEIRQLYQSQLDFLMSWHLFPFPNAKEAGHIVGIFNCHVQKPGILSVCCVVMGNSCLIEMAGTV